MLYLISTPIGNLKDLTHRAIETLNKCDSILCEDTRHSQTLLKEYNIHKPLISYHKFSEARREEKIIQELKEGKTIGLISDAGTPGISDPGTRLVKRCREENLPVTPIPGACAAIAALSCSGLDTDQFQFIGFLPKKTNELQNKLVKSLEYPGTTVCYESAKRIKNILELIVTFSPNRKIVIARELTKKFEEFISGTASELLENWKDLKGEIVLMIGQSNEWESLTPQEHVQYLESTYNLSQKDAIKLAAELRGIPKRDIYKEFI